MKIFLALVSIVFILVGNSNVSRLDKTLMVYPVKEIQDFAFGHRNTMADSFWLKTIQHMDYCENTDADRTYNPGKNLKEILTIELKPSRCHKGWVFQMIDFATDLAPKFLHAYLLGAPILNVSVDDREGSRIIYEKGLKEFPNNWQLNYYAGYLYIFELQNPAKAAELMMTAYKNGGPDFLPRLAAQLYTRTGRALYGKAILEEFIENNPDSSHLAKAKEKLKAMNEELQEAQKEAK